MTVIQPVKGSTDGPRFPWPEQWLPRRAIGMNDATDEHVHASDQALADAMATHRRQIQRFRLNGLSYWWADRLATTVLGMHPVEVWPEWFEVTDELIEYDARPRWKRRRTPR